MAGEVLVDALPYIDHGYGDPGVRESALAMVEEECRRYRPTKNYLEHLPPLTMNAFETTLMANEFERIQNREPMETLSMKRYELPPPPPGKLSEVPAWQEAIENSMAQLEHQCVRTMNLELMLDYGIESWKAYLEVFAALLAKAESHLAQVKKDIQDINWKRKQAQTQAGEKLRTLEANWVMLVSKNYEIETQCAELEKQLQSIRAHCRRIAEEQEQREEVEREEAMEQQQPEEEGEEADQVDNENADTVVAEAASPSSTTSTASNGEEASTEEQNT